VALRNFLYLDAAAVDGYLSQVEGALTDGSYTAKTQTTGSREGNIGLGVPGTNIGAGVKGGSANSQEINQTLVETPETRFSRLRKILTGQTLDEDERLQVIKAADTGTFKKIEVGELIELRGIGRLPQWEHIQQELASVQTFGKLAEAFGVDIHADPSVSQMLGQVDALTATANEEEFVLMVKPDGAPEFTVFMKLLVVNMLRDNRLILENEISIMGKVIRQFAPGQKEDVVHVLPRLDTLNNVGKKGKGGGARGRIEHPKTGTPLDETIRYPALELSTVAIFQ
jgi:hypothetical protein